MGERLRRQENMRVTARLSLENIRRAFFTGLLSSMMLPVMLVINVFSFDEGEVEGLITGLLIAAEVITIILTVLAFMAMKGRDTSQRTLVYRVFWGWFELFSFLLIFANKKAGSGITFYCVMLIVLMLIPAFETTEMIYGIVVELAYMVFLFGKFGTNGFEVFNIIIMNVLLFFMSRYLFEQTKDHIKLKERAKDSDGKVEVDRMTGLLNRKGLERRAYMSIMSSIRNKRRFSILMIDIDELQKYNHEFGTKRGDDLIIAISSIIKSAVIKNTDIVARLDGGKFLVCMEGGHGKDVERLAEKVKNLVDRKRIPNSRLAQNKFVTVSIGVSSVKPSVDNDYYDLYDVAEEAMYAAKDSGRNSIQVDNLAYT